MKQSFVVLHLLQVCVVNAGFDVFVSHTIRLARSEGKNTLVVVFTGVSRWLQPRDSENNRVG